MQKTLRRAATTSTSWTGLVGCEHTQFPNFVYVSYRLSVVASIAAYYDDYACYAFKGYLHYRAC